MLETYGYEVMTAADGTEAVVALARPDSEVAAVITDLAMPFMDGPSTIRALRKMNPSLKVIAVSGTLGNPLLGELAHFSKVSFLPKPFTTEDLLVLLHSVLEEPS
jgi:CheY-like chemotaxis protein